MLKYFQRISSSSGWSKGPKTPWKPPIRHLLHQQEVLLGEWSFGGENELQIGKLHLGWIANIQGFPTSYHELNLDSGKCPKIRLKDVLRVWLRRATHMDFWSIFHLPAQNFGQLNQFCLWMKFLSYHDVNWWLACNFDSLLPILDDSLLKK